jgi:predicted secreted Zn-dependent protease
MSALALLLALSGAALPPVAVTDRQTPYRLQGDTAAALRAGIDAAGPMHTDGRRYAGYTRWTVRADYRYEPGPRGCALVRAEVEVDVAITLPAWSPGPAATPGLAGRFGVFVGRLREHELSHRRTGVETGERVRARLGRLPPSPDCPGLRRAIDAVIAEEVREGNRRDLEIDRRTRHGELDGVRLP